MPLWGPSIQADGTGLFVELFKFLLKGHEDTYQVEYVSYDDALKLLIYSDADCAYPLNKTSIVVSLKHTSPTALVQSHPVLMSKTYLFSRPGNPVFSSMEDIKGKLLIQIRGENYNHNFKTSQARFWNVDSEIDKVTVLLEGRGDAMLGSMPEILFSFRKLGVKIPPYDPDFSALDYENALTCKASAANSEFVALFNTRIEQTLRDGSLKVRAIQAGLPEPIVDVFLLPQNPEN